MTFFETNNLKKGWLKEGEGWVLLMIKNPCELRLKVGIILRVVIAERVVVGVGITINDTSLCLS